MPLGALIPSFLGQDWWDTWDYPSRISDQCFGAHVQEDDLLPLTLIRGFLLRPRSQANVCGSGQSRIINDSTKFEVSLNVSQFKPEEIQVKGTDNFIVVRGKHEERKEGKVGHGYVTREFTRRYMLPNSCDMKTVSSTVSLDGILTISAPKKALEQAEKQETNIPVIVESDTSVKDEK